MDNEKTTPQEIEQTDPDMTVASEEEIQKVVEEFDEESKNRTFGKKATLALKIIAAAAAVYHIVALIFISVAPIEFRAIHLCIALSLILITIPASPKHSNKHRVSVLDCVLIAMAVAATVYLIIVQKEIVWRVGVSPLRNDVIFGVFLVLAILESTRRTVGLPLVIIVICFILYAVWGGYLPAFLLGRNIKFARVVSYMFSLDAGVYGTAIGISSSYVFMFLLFGAFLTASKTGDFYLKMATSAAGQYRGGPAKVAIVASALFGTICGSGVANVVTTGSFTIPLMKKHGFESHIAASVESVASTGGMIMPPLMGAGAFVLAETIGMPYSQLIKHAVIPALVYYLTLFFIIDFYSARRGLLGMNKSEMPKFFSVFKTGWFLLVPIIVLLYLLVVVNFSAVRAAFFCMLAVVVCSWFSAESRLTPVKIFEALAQGMMSALSTVAACACAGLVTCLVSVTGLSLKFTTAVLSIAGNNMFICLIFAMIITLILSMGLNATSAYIVSASLVAPVLVKLGLSGLQAHFFIFYFSCFSCITPPVCLVAYPAAGLAKCNPFKVGITSFVMALPAYILPYMAAYGQQLYGIGSFGTIARVVATCVIGSIALAACVQGWLSRNLHVLERALCGAAAACLFFPSTLTDLIGIVIAAAIVVFTRITKNKMGGGQPA